MSEQATTPYSNKCAILAELWMGYRSDPDFVDFIEYNDIGLPLAYLIAEDVVKSTTMAEQFIDETWSLFLSALELEDTGFDSLEEMLVSEVEE